MNLKRNQHQCDCGSNGKTCHRHHLLYNRPVHIVKRGHQTIKHSNLEAWLTWLGWIGCLSFEHEHELSVYRVYCLQRIRLTKHVWRLLDEVIVLTTNAINDWKDPLWCIKGLRSRAKQSIQNPWEEAEAFRSTESRESYRCHRHMLHMLEWPETDCRTGSVHPRNWAETQQIVESLRLILSFRKN